MSPNDFCHFLLGVTEMSPTLPPTSEQWRVVTTRLDSVFNKVTPNRTPVYTGENADPLPPRFDMSTPLCVPSRDTSFSSTSSDVGFYPIATGLPFRPTGGSSC